MNTRKDYSCIGCIRGFNIRNIVIVNIIYYINRTKPSKQYTCTSRSSTCSSIVGYIVYPISVNIGYGTIISYNSRYCSSCISGNIENCVAVHLFIRRTRARNNIQSTNITTTSYQIINYIVVNIFIITNTKVMITISSSR